MNVISEYMCPVLTNSVGLLSSHKESQLITNAVLELFSAVTGKMGVYSEDRSDMSFLHEVQIVQVLRSTGTEMGPTGGVLKPNL